jgi:hypothetical protein
LISGGNAYQLTATAVFTPQSGSRRAAEFFDGCSPVRAGGSATDLTDHAIAVDEHVEWDVTIGSKCRPEGVGGAVVISVVIDAVGNEIRLDISNVIARTRVRAIANEEEIVVVVGFSKIIYCR